MQIRRQEFEKVESALLTILPHIARTYGARHEISTELVIKCIEFVMDQFGNLGIGEIEHAYSLWAAGRIQCQEMYGGDFNVRQLGSVLSAYEEYRRTIINACAEGWTPEVIEAVEAPSKAKALQRMDEMKERVKTWDDVFYPIWPMIKEAGLHRDYDIPYHPILAKAKAIAKARTAKMIEREQNSYSRVSMRQTMSKDAENLAATIAGKVAVYFMMFGELPQDFAEDALKTQNFALKTNSHSNV